MTEALSSNLDQWLSHLCRNWLFICNCKVGHSVHWQNQHKQENKALMLLRGFHKHNRNNISLNLLMPYLTLGVYLLDSQRWKNAIFTKIFFNLYSLLSSPYHSIAKRLGFFNIKKLTAFTLWLVCNSVLKLDSAFFIKYFCHYQKYGTRWLKLCKLQFNMATKFDCKIYSYRRE